MIGTYKDLTLRYMGQQKKRTALNILGVILSAALITGTGTIMESTKAQMVRSAIRKEGNYHVGFRNVDKEQARIIENHLAVNDSCSGRIEGFAVLSETGHGQIPYRLLRLSLNDGKAMEMLQYRELLSDGRLPEKPGEIALDETSMKIIGNGISLGSTITLPFGQRRRLSDNTVLTDYLYPLSLDADDSDSEEYFQLTGERTFTITGILLEEFYLSENYSSSGLIWGDPGRSSEKGNYNALVLLRDLSDVRATAEAIAAAIGLEKKEIIYNTRLLNVSGKSLDRGIRESMAGFNSIITAIILMATIAVIYNSFNIALIERISQLGILRCIGSSPSQIRNLILREAGIICLVAILPGIGIGLAAMKVVFLIADSLSSNMLFEEIRVVVSPSVIASSSLICGATVLLSVLIPAWKAGSLPPVEAVRSTGLYSHDRIGKPRLTSFSAFSPGFTLLMSLRNLGRNRKRFLVTLFSMVISVVLFVSFGGMLRLAKKSYIIDSSHAPGIKVESKDEFFSHETFREMEKITGVDMLIPYGTEDMSLEIDESCLSSQYRRYVEGWEEYERSAGKIIIPGGRLICYGDKALEEMSRQSGFDSTAGIILVRHSRFTNDQGLKAYAPNSSISPGNSLVLHYKGKRIPLQPDAVMDEVYLEDFNLKEGGMDLVVSRSEFFRLTGSRGFKELYIRMTPGTDRRGIKDYLDELTRGKIGYSYVDAISQAEDMTRETQAISLFFYGFITVIALISSLNIFNTISTNLLIRSREFGIIQATGLHRRGLRKLVLMESIIYSTISLVLGGLIGTAIWYLLVRKMNDIRITVFSIPWLEIGIAAVGLILVVLLSGYFPLRRIHDRAIVENIRIEE